MSDFLKTYTYGSSSPDCAPIANLILYADYRADILRAVDPHVSYMNIIRKNLEEFDATIELMPHNISYKISFRDEALMVAFMMKFATLPEVF